MDWLPTISDRTGPIYRRIVDALIDDIANGRVYQGRRLPTHRALAAALGIDVTTVTRAYAEAARQQLVEARVGRGTFVKVEYVKRRVAAPPAIDMSMILPPLPETFDIDARLSATLAEIRRQSGFAPYLKYQLAGGSEAERGVAAEWLRPRLPGLSAERTLIGPGTQAALVSLLIVLTRPGDVVLCEALTYVGLKRAAEVARVKLRGVAMDAEGVVPSALSMACRQSRAKLVVLTPTMHNPTTATMSAERRSRVAEVLAKHRATLIEDDPYFFYDPTVQPISSLIAERSYLTASLSKCLSPGLRVSLLVTPDAACALRMSEALRATVQMSTPLMAAATLRWMQANVADTIVSAVREEARHRVELCRDVLGSEEFSAHRASPHVWLRLRARKRSAGQSRASEQLVALLSARGLIGVGSAAFAVTEAPQQGVRLALGALRSREGLRSALEIVRSVLSEAEIA